MTEPAKVRLFLAVALPPAQLDWLERCGRELGELWPAARLTSAAGRHITLKFLGATDADLVPRIAELARAVAAGASPSSVRLEGLGVFPSLRRARVLWVGLADPASLLTALAGGLDEALAEVGYEAEKRPFSPHVTLARFRAPVRIEALPPPPSPPGPFEIGSFGLWRSRLSPKGATYELLEDFILAARDVP